MTMIKPSIFTKSFANAGDFVPMPLTNSSNQPNQVSGYPIIFSTPYSAGGIPIVRNQTNGVFNAYSTQSVWLQGGGAFTFEADWISANTTYDAGILLWNAPTKSYQLSLQATAANFNADPSKLNDRINWQQITNPYQANFNTEIKNISSTYTITAEDGFKIFNPAAGTTINFPNPTTLNIGKGFTVCILNNESPLCHFTSTTGTATYTLSNPTGSQYRVITTDGFNWYIDSQLQNNYSPWQNYASLPPHGSTIFTGPPLPDPQTFVTPATTLYITSTGGGGGGGGDNGSGSGAGGGGGGTIFKYQISGLTIGDELSITIGAGGAGGNNGAGATGMETIIEIPGQDTITLYGGSGGGLHGGDGGTAGTTSIVPPPEYPYSTSGQGSSSSGGSFGGQGGSCVGIGVAGSGGGGNGHGSAGLFGGGGGGSGGNGTIGGDGGDGVCLIEW